MRRNARRATPGSQSITREQSVFVRVRAYACKKMPKYTVLVSALVSVMCYAANTCTCHNGVAQTGAGCPFNGAAKCLTCNVGWTISHDKTKCFGACAHFCIREPIITNYAVVSMFMFVLAANTCKCENGVAQSGARCSVNGASKCSLCNLGWTINHASTECIRTCARCCMYE